VRNKMRPIDYPCTAHECNAPAGEPCRIIPTGNIAYMVLSVAHYHDERIDTAFEALRKLFSDGDVP
jgi:hypothetical protein